MTTSPLVSGTLGEALVRYQIHHGGDAVDWRFGAGVGTDRTVRILCALGRAVSDDPLVVDLLEALEERAWVFGGRVLSALAALARAGETECLFERRDASFERRQQEWSLARLMGEYVLSSRRSPTPESMLHAIALAWCALARHQYATGDADPAFRASLAGADFVSWCAGERASLVARLGLPHGDGRMRPPPVPDVSVPSGQWDEESLALLRGAFRRLCDRELLPSEASEELINEVGLGWAETLAKKLAPAAIFDDGDEDEQWIREVWASIRRTARKARKKGKPER